MAKIIRGDDVIVVTGKSKGKVGKVIAVLVDGRQGGRCLVKVSGVAICRKGVKATKDRESGVVSFERFMDVSNVALFDNETGARSKVGYKFVDGKKLRYLRCSGRVLD